MGVGFDTEPEELRKDAEANLGEVVEAMERSRDNLLRTNEHVDLFRGEGSIFENIELYWSDTRYYLERVLSDNMENLRLAKDALIEIADRYESDDQQMAEILNRAGS